jgi:2-isopropylmalate synthase
VGSAAFAHKAGVHIDALMKLPGSYEHMNPELVGNSTRYVVSDQAGSSAVVERAQRLGFKLDKKSDEARAILDRVKAAENAGYEFEAAEASFELLVLRTMGQFTQKFAVKDFFVIVNRLEDAALSQAIVRVAVNGVEAHTVADGDGPVHALDSALRKALEPHFPPLSAIRLTDFKVRVVNVRAGTAARVRVLVECADAHGKTWSTIGVHENIIMASLEALCDALSYGLRLYGLSLCA